MGPFVYTEAVVARTLIDWFSGSGELFVELYKPHSGGSGFFYVLNSFEQYEMLMANAESGSYSFVLRDGQLPIRGIVDDTLISEALNQIPDGHCYLIVEPCVFPQHFSYLGEGESHGELRSDLEKLRGSEVWAGLDIDIPADYWKEDLAEDALVAKKMEE